MPKPIFARLSLFLLVAISVPGIIPASAQDESAGKEQASFAEATAGLTLVEGFIDIYSSRENGIVTIGGQFGQCTYSL